VVIRFSIGKKYADRHIFVYEVNSKNCSLAPIDCWISWVQLEIEGDSTAIEEVVTLSFPTNGIFKVSISMRTHDEWCAFLVHYWFEVKGAPPKSNRSPLDYIAPNRRVALLQGVNFDPPAQFVRSTERKIRVKFTRKKTSPRDLMQPKLWGLESLDGHSVSWQYLATDSDSVYREISFPQPGIYTVLARIGVSEGDKWKFNRSFTQFYQIDEPGARIPGTSIHAGRLPSEWKFVPISPKEPVGSVANGVSLIQFGADSKYVHFSVFVREVVGGDPDLLTNIESDCDISVAQFKMDSERRETRIGIKYPKNGLFKIDIHCMDGYDWKMLTAYWFEVNGAAPRAKNSLSL
jgi:hypothetical protein